MRLWYKKGSILLRTGNTIPGMKSQSEKYLRGKCQSEKYLRGRIKLSWKVKVMIKNVYKRERLSVKFPEKCNCLEIGIWDQLSSDNSWGPRINKLSDEICSRYYHIKIWSCDTIVCLFGVRSTWQVVWVSKKVNDPNMSGVVLVLMLLRSLLAWSRLWSKHEMHEA